MALSVIGAYFSIIGLATIFPGGEKSVIVMASTLEVAKIVSVIWLHKNWSKAKILLKSYLVFSVLVLMGITSLGIFGFLTKSHVEHQYLTEKEKTFIEEFDLKIEKEEDLIKKYENYIIKNEKQTTNPLNKFQNQKKEIQERIKMLEDKFNKDIEFEKEKINTIDSIKDELNKVLNEAESSKGGLFSNKQKKIELIRNNQRQKRAEIENQLILIKEEMEKIKNNYDSEYSMLYQSIENINKEEWVKGDGIEENSEIYNNKIEESINKIQEFKKEKLKFNEKIMLLEAEIGPLKYVVGLISDTTGRSFENSQAVRLIIVIIMTVFDPLAILLLIAAQESFKKNRGEFINNTYVDLHNKINKIT